MFYFSQSRQFHKIKYQITDKPSFSADEYISDVSQKTALLKAFASFFTPSQQGKSQLIFWEWDNFTVETWKLLHKYYDTEDVLELSG